MWWKLISVLPLILSTLAIKVPVDDKQENATEIIPVNTADKKQDTFYISEDANVDSYLIPPDPHRPEDVIYDISGTPATYLLPPSPEKHVDYYAPTEAGEQTDWYPIAQQAPSAPIKLLPHQQPEAIPILQPNQSFRPENFRVGKALNNERVIPPSRHLELPVENGPSDYVIRIPSKELELPVEGVYQPFNISPQLDYKPLPIQKPKRKHNLKKNFGQLKAVEPTLALHLTPPKLLPTKYKNPTKLYPKKVSKGFQPIPIPIAQFAEGTLVDVPSAKPVKPFKPVSSDESEYFTPSDEKKIYLYEQAEQKRNLNENNNPAKQEQLAVAVEDTYGVNAPPTEQETSETNYRHPGRNVYPAPLRQAPPVVPHRNAPAPPAPDERTEFRMHGMKGPHSYQFGFDTGKGKNRQFRFEERDNDGRVKGHYGYMDRQGKLRVVNYDADPEHGFHAEEPVEKE